MEYHNNHVLCMDAVKSISHSTEDTPFSLVGFQQRACIIFETYGFFKCIKVKAQRTKMVTKI